MNPSIKDLSWKFIIEARKSSSKLIILSIILKFTLPNAFAENAPSVSERKETPSSSASYGQYDRWTLYGGAAAGYDVVSGQSYTNSPHGGQVLLNASLTYQMEKWLLDGGIGWFYSNLFGKNSSNQDVQIVTRAGLLELSPRIKISQQWQIGPVVNAAFGTDTTFQPSLGGSTLSYFLGLKGVWQIPEMKLPTRLWAQISNGQGAYLALVGIQIGIPFHGNSSHTELSPQISSTQASSQMSNKVHVILDPQKIFFGTNSTTLKENVRKALAEIADYLHYNEKSAVIEISGHADQRGTFQHNLILSEKRAKSVQSAFLSGSFDPSRMSVKAYSYLKPQDPANSTDAWAKNRRVELIFNHVQKTDLLYEKLKPLIVNKPWDGPRNSPSHTPWVTQKSKPQDNS